MIDATGGPETDRPTLGVDPDTVCFLVVKARAYHAMAAANDEADGSDPADDDESTALLATANDTTAEEIRGAVESLSEDERAEVRALMWIGRGDYEVEAWADAVTEARRRAGEPLAETLLTVPLVAEYLEDALEGFGHTCADIEAEHL